MGKVWQWRCILLAFILGLTSSAWADVQEGIDAYDRGDYDTAMKELQPLAEQGDDQAQFTVGLMYSKGQGLPQDDQKAVMWFHLAAEQGVAGAQANLGAMYARGRGVLEDYVLAHMWLNLAGAQGDKTAIRNRDLLETRLMTPTQLAEAQRLAREWQPKKK
jgi:hypothetical protein